MGGDGAAVAAPAFGPMAPAAKADLEPEGGGGSTTRRLPKQPGTTRHLVLDPKAGGSARCANRSRVAEDLGQCVAETAMSVDPAPGDDQAAPLAGRLALAAVAVLTIVLSLWPLG